MGAAALRAARRAGQTGTLREGIAAGQAGGRGDAQPFAMGRQASGEVREMIGHRLFRDADQAGKLMGRVLPVAQCVGQGLADSGQAGSRRTWFDHS